MIPKKMSLEIKIEIRSIVKKKTNPGEDGNTHDFYVFVQGLNGNRIEHFVKQVVFYLPSKSSDSKRAKSRPPYLMSGSARTSFRLPIEIFLHTSDLRNKVEYSYYVHLPNKLVENAVNVKTLTFLNAPQEFRERLLLGGAEVVDLQKNSTQVITQVKNEPVEIAENQNEFAENAKSPERKAAPSKNDENGVKVNSPEREVVSNKNDGNGVQVNSPEREVVSNKSQEEADSEKTEESIEPTENVYIPNEIPNLLPNASDQSSDNPEQNGSLVIQSIFSLDELKRENEDLKKENETLFDKFSNQERLIATYAEKLPVLQNDFSAVSTELSLLNQKAETNEAEISALKSAVQLLMCEILKRKNKEPEGQTKRPEVPIVPVQGK